MSGLINVIKSLFGGIFGFIGGLFGGKKAIDGSTPKAKKGNGYFLELDEAKTAPAASAPAAKPEAEQPMTVSQEAIAEASNNGSQPAKTSTRKEKLAALAAADQPAAASATPTAPAAPQPVPVAVANPVAEANFATKYLIPANNGTRRRPGANMSSYLDMARKMNPAG